MSEYNQKKIINSCQKAHDTPIHLFDGQSSIKRQIRALCRTRVLVEQTFGILKRRFNVLHDGFRVEPRQVVEYISSCVVLHDIGIDRNDVVVNNDITEIPIDNCLTNQNINPTFDGVTKRIEIAQQ